MNFKKLPKEKKKQLALVAVFTALALAGLSFGVVKRQFSSLDQMAAKTEAARKQLRKAQDTIKQGPQVEAELNGTRAALATAESDVASGDLYAWVVNTLRRFKAGYKVEIPQISPLGAPADVNLLPDFPYKQAGLVVSGTGRFHDIGRFVADLENQFPHARVLNLSLEPNPSAASGEEETLSFRMDLIMLVKVNPS
jgi:Tfp pilus assembly protein PilO